MSTTSAEVERVYREHRARMLAALLRAVGDFELAEDVLQDACALALRRWESGLPDDPVAWLLTVARNRAIDRLRRARLGREKEAVAPVHDFPAEERLVSVGDERPDDYWRPHETVLSGQGAPVAGPPFPARHLP